MFLESSETKNRRGSGVIDRRSLPILAYVHYNGLREGNECTALGFE